MLFRSYKKDLQHQDNHDGMITHLEPDILECEVKWALESITMNKASAAAAAKSLQLCLTLCNPVDGSPPGCPSMGLSRQEHWIGVPLPSPRLSYSIVFLYFFALITEEGFLISSCYSLERCIQIGIAFLFSFAFHFSSFHSYL